jgi:transcription antitermination factor NusG
MPWFAIYTKPRTEKKVVERLEKLGIDVYCPMVKQVKQWSDRKKKVETPLIASYVFVNIADANRQNVFQAEGVVRYLFWLGKPAVVAEQDIARLKDTLKDTFSSIEATHLQPGTKMTIPAGPFKGKEGTITNANDKRVQLVLEELGCVITLTR